MNTKFFRWTVSLAAILGMSVTLTGCGDGEKDSAKLLSGEKKLSAEEERIQKLFTVRVWDEESQAWIEELPQMLLGDVGGHLLYRAKEVYVEGGWTLDRCQTDEGNSPGVLLSNAMALNKIARTLVPIVVTDPADSSRVVYRIPPQEHTTRVGLYYAARERAYSAIGSALKKMGASTTSLSWLCNDEDQLEAEQLVEIIGLAYDLFVDSTNGAVESSVIAGDVLRARAPSDAEGRAWQYSAREFSRNSAAHLIAGGPAGYYRSTTFDPFCGDAPLSPTQRRALELMRIAAPRPSDVLSSSMPIEELIGGGLSSGDPTKLPWATVHEGLSWFLPMPDLDAGADVPALMNLSLDDFRAARVYLQRELTSIPRTGRLLPDQVRHAATATPPKPLADVAYGAMTRQFDWGWLPDTIEPPTDANWGNLDLLGFDSSPSLDQFRGQLSRTLKTFLPVLGNRIASESAALRTRLERTAKGGVVELIDRIDSQAWGSIRMFYAFNDQDSTWYLVLQALLKSPEASLSFARGYDGLRCALEGNVEGAACISTDRLDMAPLRIDVSEGDSFRFVHSYVYPIVNDDIILDPIFVLDSSGGSPKAVFGAYFDVTPSASVGAEAFVFEESTQRVAKLLALNSDWCGEAKFDCMGNSVTETLPLENELSKDELGPESSWRRYLDLAHQAASEAELRGKEYFESGLEVERRKEEIWRDRDSRTRQAVEQIQEICGTALDPKKLLGILEGGGLPAPESPTCSESVKCNPDEESELYQCIAGQCVVDFGVLVARLGKEDEGMSRLAQCLSSTVEPVASPGDKQLCYWVDPNNENSICQGGDATMECPRVALSDTSVNADEACKDFKIPSGMDWRVLPQSATLKYFNIAPSTPSQSKDKTAEVCSSLRAIRAELGAKQIHGDGPALTPEQRSAALLRIGESGLFHPDTFAELASGWAFEILPESNMRITYRGTELWTTGRIGLGNSPTASWPCGGVGRPADCSVEHGRAAGILCDYVGSETGADATVGGCNDAWARGNFAERLRRASWAIGIARPSHAQGKVAVDHFFDVSFWTDSESRPCNGADELIQRSNKAPIRQRRCGPNSTQFTVDSESRSERIIWYGGKGMYKVMPENHNEIIPVALWHWDSVRQDSWFELTQGGWTERYTLDDVKQFVGEDGENGMLNGLSRARPVGTKHPLMGIAAETLLANPKRPLSEELMEEWNPSTGTVLDGLELYCQAQVTAGNECNPGAPPPTISSAADLPQAGKYLQCLGDTILSRAGKTLVARVPTMAMDALRKASAVGAFPLVGGKYGEAVSQLRAALVELSDVGPAIASEIRQMGNDVDAIAAALRINDLQSEMADVQFLSSVGNALAACGSSGTWWGAIAQCGNALAQTHFLGQLKQLQKESAEQAGIRDLAQFRNQLEARSRTLSMYGNRISAALERLDSQLATLEGLRLSAQRSASDAVYAATFTAPNTEAINNSLAWKYQESRRRYEESTKVARSLAIVARRAIEQRLAIRLESLKDPLPLVDAPSTWVQGICQAEGLSFEDISKTVEDSVGGTDNIKAFLGNFISDYVGRLERTVESYRMAFPFQDGVDEAVVSARNDLLKTREACDAPSPNLVPNATQLDQMTGTNSPGTGWTQYDCRSADDAAKFVGCIAITPYNGAIALSNTEAMQFYFLDFDMSHCAAVGCTSDTSPKLGMALELNAGWYNLTYYSGEDNLTTCFTSPALLDEAGGVVPFQGDEHYKTIREDTSSGSRIRRYDRRFQISGHGTYSLQFGPSEGVGCSGAYHGVYLGRIMLVRQTAADWNSGKVPPFVDSDANGMTRVALCQDSDGSSFRRKNWSEERCIRLCEDGYSQACDERSGHLECYREMRFSLDEARIESTSLFQGAGFAKGNYNYRVEQIGVNFVGTGVKDCSQSTTPDSCYANANIQYSIEHLGPFFVRNHMGDDIEAKIFNGRIEHARGLASERYLTNPVSSTDHSLLDPYLRNEFQGRPLGGEYVLRVWNSPELNFDRIEDVQIFLRYRYWTRQK